MIVHVLLTTLLCALPLHLFGAEATSERLTEHEIVTLQEQLNEALKDQATLAAFIKSHELLQSSPQALSTMSPKQQARIFLQQALLSKALLAVEKQSHEATESALRRNLRSERDTSAHFRWDADQQRREKEYACSLHRSAESRAKELRNINATQQQELERLRQRVQEMREELLTWRHRDAGHQHDKLALAKRVMEHELPQPAAGAGAQLVVQHPNNNAGVDLVEVQRQFEQAKAMLPEFYVHLAKFDSENLTAAELARQSAALQRQYRSARTREDLQLSAMEFLGTTAMFMMRGFVDTLGKGFMPLVIAVGDMGIENTRLKQELAAVQNRHHLQLAAHAARDFAPRPQRALTYNGPGDGAPRDLDVLRREREQLQAPLALMPPSDFAKASTDRGAGADPAAVSVAPEATASPTPTTGARCGNFCSWLLFGNQRYKKE